MKKPIALLLALVLALSLAACADPEDEAAATGSTPGGGHTRNFVDFEIPVEVRGSIEPTQTQLIEWLADDRERKIYEIAGGELNEDNAEFSLLLEQLGGLINSAPYKLFECYTIFGDEYPNNTRIAKSDDAEFSFLLTPYDQECYTVFYSFTDGYVSYLLHLVFARAEVGDWALFEIGIDNYKYYGNSLLELAALAADYSAKGQHAPAYLFASFVGGALESQQLLYKDQDEMLERCRDAIAAFDESGLLPLAASADGGAIEIFGLTPTVADGDLYLVVEFTTAVPIGSTAGINYAAIDQARALHEQLDSLLPGLREHTQQVVYRAYNGVPTEAESFPAYETSLTTRETSVEYVAEEPEPEE